MFQTTNQINMDQRLISKMIGDVLPNGDTPNYSWFQLETPKMIQTIDKP